MARLDFQVSTRRTGILRTVWVTVYDETTDFMAAFHRESERRGLDHSIPENYLVHACCLGRRTWEDRDPRTYQVRMIFDRSWMSATTIAHEAVHAANHIYSIDCYRDNARASSHLILANEIVPYIVGDLFAAITRRMMDEGLEITVGDSGEDI